MVSEVGFSGEWLERHDTVEAVEHERFGQKKVSISLTAGWWTRKRGTFLAGGLPAAGNISTFRGISGPRGRTDGPFGC